MMKIDINNLNNAEVLNRLVDRWILCYNIVDDMELKLANSRNPTYREWKSELSSLTAIIGEKNIKK